MRKIQRVVCLAMVAFLLMTNSIIPVEQASAANADSGQPFAKCYLPSGTSGLRLDGDCKASYTFSSGGQGTTITMNDPPGGNFNDDYGNCYIVNTQTRNYDEISCSDATRRTLEWVGPTGPTGLAMSSINWLSRLSFRAPISIFDSGSNTEYRTNSDIFGDGTSSYLNDGDSNAWYIYVPVGSNKEPIANPAGQCLGVFAVELNDDGSDMWLKAIQPTRTSDGSECVFGSEDADQGRVSGIGDDERARMHDIGSGGNEISGRDDKWRLLVAPFFWANENSIRGFDSSKAPFTPLSGSALDEAKATWESSDDADAPPTSERTAEGWRYFKSADCSDEVLAVKPDNKDLYIFKIDGGAIIDAQTSGFSQCALGRNLEGGSTSLINAVGIPTAIAFVENATRTEAEVDTGDFTDSGSTVDPTAEEEVTEAEPTCFTAGGFLSWILCPVLTVLDETTQFLERQIQGFLFVSQDQFDRDGPIYKSWSSFRGIATVIIIIIAAIMIFSQAMGEGIFDNYSVKKLLPRLILAGIGIQLSWFAMILLIDFFNVLGDGIAGLLLNPFESSSGVALNADTNLRDLMGDLFRTSSAGDFFTGLAAVTIGGIALIGAFVALAVGAAAALFVGFITLIIRNMIIFIGVVMSPVAIAMSVLPGTQKTSKWWWESFEKALMMYPLVMALLSVGKILAVLLLNAAETDGDEGIKMTYVIAAIVAWYAPFFLLPKALQAGGAALGKISGLAGDKSKGWFDKAKGINDNYKKTRKERKTREAFDPNATGVRAGLRRTGAYISAGAIGKGTSFERGSMRVKGAGEAMQRRLFNETTALSELEIKEAQTASERAFNNASIDSFTEDMIKNAGLVYAAGHKDAGKAMSQKDARQVLYSRLASLDDDQEIEINGTTFKGSWAVRDKAQKSMLDAKMFANVIDPSSDPRFAGKQTSLSYVDATTGARSGVMETLASGSEALQKSRNSFVNGNFSDVKNKMPDEINPSAKFDFFSLGADKLPEMDDSRVQLWHKQIQDAISSADAVGVANLMRQVNDLAKRGAPKKLTDELRDAVEKVSPTMAADVDTVISSKGNRTFDPTTGTII